MTSSAQSSSSLQQFLLQLQLPEAPQPSYTDVYLWIDFHPHVFAFLLNLEFCTLDINWSGKSGSSSCSNCINLWMDSVKPHGQKVTLYVPIAMSLVSLLITPWFPIQRKGFSLGKYWIVLGILQLYMEIFCISIPIFIFSLNIPLGIKASSWKLTHTHYMCFY